MNGFFVHHQLQAETPARNNRHEDVPDQMNWPNLKRARRITKAPAEHIFIAVCGTCAALVTPALLIVLGFTVRLFVDREWRSVMELENVEAFRLGLITIEPLFQRYEYCVLGLIGVGLVLSLVTTMMLYLLYREIHNSSIQVVAELKRQVHEQSLRLGPGDLLEADGSRADTLFTENVELIRGGLVAWWRAIPQGLVSLTALVLLATLTDFLLAFLAILLAIAIWRGYVIRKQISVDATRHARDQADQRHERLREGLRVAPLSANQSRLVVSGTLFTENLKTYCSAAFRSAVSEAYIAPLLVLFVLVAVSALLVVVGLPHPARMTVAETVVLGATLVCGFFPTVRLYQLPTQLRSAESAAKEVFAYLDREPRVLQVTGADVLARIQVGIELDRVTVADRDGRKLLDEISLHFPAGGRFGVLASNPRTPMALAGLFVRYFDPKAGRVLFDNHDIRHVTLDSLREQAALVRNHDALFTGEVAENIDCGDSRYTLLHVTDAAKRAGAYEFIQQLPQGFSTIVGNHGERLEPRQEFRIALARAMLRDPSILFIEEPSANGADEQGDNIGATLAEIAKGRTLIYIPNRIATLRSLDRIYLFHEGKLHAVGNHMELIQASDLYRHLNYVLFNPFRNMTN